MPGVLMSKQLLTVLSALPPSITVKGIENLACNALYKNHLKNLNASILRKIKKLERVLIISDANIGDSVNLQCCVEAFKHCFPDSKVDYVCSYNANLIIYKNPNISRVYPVMYENMIPSSYDLSLLGAILEKQNYDLVINFCPFIERKFFKKYKNPVIFPVYLVSSILNAVKNNEKANIIYRATEFINEIAQLIRLNTQKHDKEFEFKGNRIYFSEHTIRERNKFMQSVNLKANKNIVFFNPDTSNSYTFASRDMQLEIINRILASNDVDCLLLGSGFTFEGIEQILYERIKEPFKKKVIIIPKTISIDVYASLIDVAKLFITGDTGQMHIASAKKVFCKPAKKKFNNKTAIVSLFGATNSKVYGYDSFKDGYLPSSQDAPSCLFEGNPKCKNIICSIQRITNKCKKHNCFEGLDLNSVMEYTLNYLKRSHA
jgi:ADP-heptose:LPS heptosyltransferase